MVSIRKICIHGLDFRVLWDKIAKFRFFYENLAENTLTEIEIWSIM